VKIKTLYHNTDKNKPSFLDKSSVRLISSASLPTCMFCKQSGALDAGEKQTFIHNRKVD
jgi:hypothetical protein